MVAAVVVTVFLVLRRIDRWIGDVPLAGPPGSQLSLFERLFDQTPIEVTTTVQWRKVPVITTVDAVRTDPALWRTMFFDDWDRRVGL